MTAFLPVGQPIYKDAKALLRKQSLSLDYGHLVFIAELARLFMYSFNYIYADLGAVGTSVSTKETE